MQGHTSELISVIRSGEAPSAAFLARVPHAFARRHLVLSAGVRDGVELLRVTQDTSSCAVHNTSVRLGRRVTTRLEGAEVLAAAIDREYGTRATASEDSEGIAEGTSDDIEAQIREVATSSDVLDTSSKGPIVRLVDLLLFEASHQGASDVHIQPLADRVLIRYRFDGVLHDVRVLSARREPRGDQPDQGHGPHGRGRAGRAAGRPRGDPHRRTAGSTSA